MSARHPQIKHGTTWCKPSDISINENGSIICLVCKRVSHTITCPNCQNDIDSKFLECPNCKHKL